MAWSKTTRIKVMMAIDIVFFALEIGVGVAVHSLALIADAFHMLNDIISLYVGLYAIRASQNPSTDEYSFGWLRSEIIGAFFNATFLIALCLSILLESITRFIDPPVISNPKLILIVGCMGLASNLAGFIVLGGHGHSHGPEGHGHSHDEVRDAEEGHTHSGIFQSPSSIDGDPTEGNAGEVFPEAVVERVKSRASQNIRFTDADIDTSTRRERGDSTMSRASRLRRASGRYNIDDLSIHPSSFRQEIIAASRSQLDNNGIENTAGSEDVNGEDTLTENSPLISKHSGNSSRDNTAHQQHNHSDHPSARRPRRDSLHAGHNHNKPKPAKGGHSHNHSDMGMNAMILHVIGDALGNVGVIVSALIIWLTTWSGRYYADPAVSLFITMIILRSTIPLTSATAKILLQATPEHIVVNDIKEDIEDIPGIVSCHHIHIWQLSDTQIVASMHIQLALQTSEAYGEKYMELSKAARKCLHAYGIHSATIQPEFCLDRDHDHAQRQSLGLDDAVPCPADDCLLVCVDDCEGRGCCSPRSANSQHSHSDDDHSH